MSRLDRRDSWITKIPTHCELTLNKISNPTDVDDVLYDLLAEPDGLVSVKKFWSAIRSTGLRMSDPRLRETKEMIERVALRQLGTRDFNDLKVEKETFLECVAVNIFLISKAFKNDMVIPELFPFTRRIEDIYYKCKCITRGKPADYIPQLARADPRIWAVSLCTVDGQRFSLGQTDISFCLQSCCKPLNYALAISDLGSDEVHKWVGQEPSGRSFNELTLDDNKKPHNPMINAGAIVTTSLLKPHLQMADRFDYASNQYKRLAGGEHIGFSNTTYLSERETADRNFALGYYMRENKCFPEGTNLQQTLEYYFQLCSVECNTDSGSVIAATFANGGICPTTGERVLNGDAVRNTLSLMYACGMYDYSGQFAFKVGLPAKSGVAGAILLVVPNVMGLCCWSPPLDSMGNSCRGVQLCEDLVSMFNFHNYDDLKHTEKKMDPRKRKVDNEANCVVNLLFGAANGDVSAIRRFALSDMDMTASDYDGRTALHLAAAEGHLQVVRLLLEKCKVPHDPKDRWGNPPIADAQRFGHKEVAEYLEEYARREAISPRVSAVPSPLTKSGPPANIPVQVLTPQPQQPPRDRERRDMEGRETERREMERREAERRDKERRDMERRDTERRDTERRETERRETERRDKEKRDTERRDTERRDTERRDTERRDTERRDTAKVKSSNYLSVSNDSNNNNNDPDGTRSPSRHGSKRPSFDESIPEEPEESTLEEDSEKLLQKLNEINV